jgi:hypothetical protein
MKTIREVGKSTLELKQSSTFKNACEIRSHSNILGRLSWEKASDTRANADSAEGCWTFERTGFFTTKIVVRDLGQDTEKAVFTCHWRGSDTLNFADGRTYQWVWNNGWGTAGAFTTTEGEPLVQFLAGGGLFSQTVRVELATAALELPDPILLVLLGWYWYMLLMYQQDLIIAGTMGAAAMG